MIPDIQFETNSAKIKPESYVNLENAINVLKDWGNSSVEIAGHTDQRGTSKAEHNQKLSENALKQYLITS